MNRRFLSRKEKDGSSHRRDKSKDNATAEKSTDKKVTYWNIFTSPDFRIACAGIWPLHPWASWPWRFRALWKWDLLQHNAFSFQFMGMLLLTKFSLSHA